MTRNNAATAAFSPTMARALLLGSPAHARWKAEHDVPSTPGQLRGQIVHALILGQDGAIAEVPYRDYRTDTARVAREAARQSGKIPVLAKERAEYDAIAASARAALAAAGIDLAGGQTERKITWGHDIPDGGVLRCSGRLDWSRDEILQDPLILEVKTVGNASPAALERDIVSKAWDLQAAAYQEAVPGARFLWLAVELDEPYAASVCEPAGTMRELGRLRWDRACEIWARCVRAGEWPAFQGVSRVEAPAWALMAEGF